MPTEPGSWGGLTVRVSLPEVGEVAGSAETLFRLVNAALEIGLAVLEVVGSFTVPTLNPVRALLNELVTLCRSTLADLRKLGVYAHFGDARLVRTPRALKGGYAAYERRMLARLTDRSDLRRPNFGPNTTTVALFVYTAVDLGFVDDLLDTSRFDPMRTTISAFARLLGAAGLAGTSRNAALPRATGLSSSYGISSPRRTGTDPVSDFALGVARMAGADRFSVSWTSAPVEGDEPPLPPAGWLVEVSTAPNGFAVGYASPVPSGTGTENGSAAYVTGAYEEGDSGVPLRVFGGLDTIEAPGERAWNRAVVGGEIARGASPIYFFRDSSRPETLSNPFAPSSGSTPAGTYYNGRTFFVGPGTIRLQALAGARYSITLSREDLPKVADFAPDGTLLVASARPPEAVWVRVTAVNREVTADNYRTLRWNPLPRRGPGDERVTFSGGFSADVRGAPSEALAVTIPPAETSAYTLSLQVALALLALTRSDLRLPEATTSTATPADSAFIPTGLEGLGGSLLPSVLDGDPGTYFGRRGFSPASFTADLFRRVSATANDLLDRTGIPPAAVLRNRAAVFRRLVEFRWSDTELAGFSGLPGLNQTVLESLTVETEGPGTTVLARNAYSLPGTWEDLGRNTPARTIGELRARYPRAGYGSGNAPKWAAPLVLDRRSRKIAFVRELVPSEILDAAREVLTLAGGVTVREGGWIAWRPFATVGPLANSDRYLGAVEGFLSAAAAGVGGVENALDTTVAFLEQRVAGLQELLRRLDTYLDVPFSIAIPDAVALPIVANGTEGIVSGLLGAGNKPSDGPTAYAGGTVLLAGGLPSILTDLTISLLSG